MLAYPSPVPINHHWTVNFPEHLAALRKQKGMTQQQLADRVGVHVVQLRRYEAGTSQPTLDVIRSMAVALGIVQMRYFSPRTSAARTMPSSSSSRPSPALIRSPRRSSSRSSTA